jgi:hypothetical protein
MGILTFSGAADPAGPQPGGVTGDFTTWTLAGANIDKFNLVSASRIDYTDLRRDDVAYAYADGGAGYFGNNGMDIDVDINVDSETGDLGDLWVGFSNTIPGDWQNVNNNNDGIGLEMREWTANLILHQIGDFTPSPNTYTTLVLGAMLIERHATFFWNGTTFRVSFYIDEARAFLQYSNTVTTDAGAGPYRYMIIGSRGIVTPASATLTGSVQNVVIHNRGV